MASKTHGEAGTYGDGVAGALERLYGAPFDEFVTRRKELAASLRAAGDVAGSRLVAAATKPSRSAWALNQVARRRPELLRATLEARARAASAQTGGEDVRATARAFRERLAEVVQAAGDVTREDGGDLTIAQGRRISATVQAAAAGEDRDLLEKVTGGRLVADVDVDDPFAGLEPGPPREKAAKTHAADDAEPEKVHAKSREPERAHAKSREPERVHAKSRDHEAEARARELEKARERERERREQELEKARARVAALEDEAREARAAAREAEVAAARARTEAERLRRAVEAVEKKLSDAKGELRSLGT